MLPIYLGALAFGGTMLVASLVLGHGDGAHGGLHAGGGHGGAGHAHGHGDAWAWFPVASLRFWTFFLGFGGLTGTVLTYVHAGARPVVAIAAIVLGWAAGVGVVVAMRRAQRGGGASQLEAADLRGETAEVTVAIAPGAIGKVRVRAKGRVFDLIAESDEDRRLAAGARVMIVGEGDGGRVQVVASPGDADAATGNEAASSGS
ncbi:MAG TPA: hypothetical protein VHE35_30605 [Kofleriaceae bacterium]|nr:hypothetical protein [Kofleriaceae bacterium]